MGRAACLVLLAALPFALYGVNLDDYFVGDDFDFLVSMHEKPASYFWQRLYANESGDVWKDAGFDDAQGHGYLRPVKIWLLKANQVVSGTDPFGYHLTSTLVFSGLAIALFLLVEELLPGRRALALWVAGAAALHPTFAEIVPFITARDEALATLFALLAIRGWVRFRTGGRSPWVFVGFYALALLSKESAFPVAGIAVGYDLVHGHLDLRSDAGRRALLRAHLPTALLLAAYFTLRFIAFGNFKGGDTAETTFTSFDAFLRFHAWFFRSLLAPSQLAVPWPGVFAAGVLLAAATAFARIWRGDDRAPWLRRLAFAGPVWYVGSTALLHGTYFTTRHHGMAVIGLLLLLATLLAAVTERWKPARQWALCVGLLVASAGAFAPPTVALARAYDAAAGVTERTRRAIDEHTRDLPDGCRVKILNAPQWTERPWYFGWGLRSALMRPFTPGDLANRCLVYNERNVALTKAKITPPERFDRVLDVGTRTTRSPAPPRR